MTAKPSRITNFYSGASAVVAFVTQPVPALDELVVVPIHYRLCTRLARERGVPKKDLPWKQIRKIIWYGAGARLAANLSLGLVPVVGMFSNAVTAIALTEFLGHYIDHALANPGVPPPEVTMEGMKALFADALRRHAEKKGTPEKESTIDPSTPATAAEDAAPPSAEATESPRQEDHTWRAKLHHALKGVRLAQVRDGTWFRSVLERHAQTRKAALSVEHWDAVYPGLDVEARADKHVRLTARKAAAAGALASAGASAGELLTLFTDGLAVPIGVPAVMLSMAAEGAYTTLLQLELASDLASMYGVPFGDDVAEMSTLFALAFGTDHNKEKKSAKEEDETGAEGGAAPKRGLLARLMELEESDLATHIGKKLLEEAVLRNIVPLVGVGISARWNLVATEKFAAHIRKYVRYRRALTRACDHLRLADVPNPEVFVRGAWLLASCDGEATHEEVMAIARVLEQFPDAERQLPAFDVDDEEAWFARVQKIPDEIADRLIDLLCLVAAIDRDLAVPEQRFLSRLGKTLNRSIDFPRIEALCRHLRDGHDPPEDFFAPGRSSFRPSPEVSAA
jgi:uncharacterized protein (DUF697 family)